MPALARATARGTLVVTAGQLALAAAGFLAALLLARELGPDGFWQDGHMPIGGMRETNDDLSARRAERVDLARREIEMHELNR